MSYKLFIDDIREPETESWVIARSWAEAVEIILNRGCPEFISFDHDLGCIPYTRTPAHTGLGVAKWLVEQDIDNRIIPENFDFAVHSANPIGAENIRSYLRNYLNTKNS